MSCININGHEGIMNCIDFAGLSLIFYRILTRLESPLRSAMVRRSGQGWSGDPRAGTSCALRYASSGHRARVPPTQPSEGVPGGHPQKWGHPKGIPEKFLRFAPKLMPALRPKAPPPGGSRSHPPTHPSLSRDRSSGSSRVFRGKRSLGGGNHGVV